MSYLLTFCVIGLFLFMLFTVSRLLYSSAFLITVGAALVLLLFI